MNYFHSILLGIIQGLTEFIPVSSTAHLLITQYFLGIKADDIAFSFSILVQLGTIVSLIIFFWKDLTAILFALFKYLGAWLKKQGTVHLSAGTLANARLAGYILFATIPALVFGILLKPAVEALFRTPLLEAAIRLLITAVLLALVEWLGKRNRSLEKMTWLDALFIGLAQVLAVFPGASRSGTTISGGMARGFDRPSAARFAFLMSIPVMLAAGGYESLELFKMPGLAASLPLFLLGIVTAAVVGWFAIKWLLSYLNKHSLYVFAIYCAIFGLVVLLIHLV